MKKTILMLLLAGFAASFLSACNTVEGAGRDVQGAGEAIEDSAQRHND
ncbi:entericidin A/B family lipoprotein [Coralloluteibacterium stylophorae]|uniref:Entericidin A/B family lipoprotein n=1 Tax=Coralloluteibacterium stylophorae TaxID=1776034 RepID=A0A8J8AYK5_9GAMM|nr:entericidin A/B family lipoprotein [Coralloluteibacterium stylophorae]MBS7458201.1 entericidin A/B family lipoprotein [Coralloluteibacterium stylophorae]